MSAEHRKPAVAFAVLALVAATLVGMQRADAQGGSFLAAVAGATVRVQGTVPRGAVHLAATARDGGAALGPALDAVLTEARERSGGRDTAAALVGTLGPDTASESRTAPKSRHRAEPREQVRIAPAAGRAGSSRAAGPAAEVATTRDDRRTGHRADRRTGGADDADHRREGSKAVERASERRGARAEWWAERRTERLERRAEQLERKAERRLSRALLQASLRAERLERRAERRAERARSRAQRRAHRHVEHGGASALDRFGSRRS